MPQYHKIKYADAGVASIAKELQCELGGLQHVREQAAVVDEDYINPAALDLLAHHVARLNELAKQQSVDAATIDAIYDAVAFIEAAAHALHLPMIDRTR